MWLFVRWKDKGVYDILVECAELSLDVSENAGLSSDERITSNSLPQLSHGIAPLIVVSNQRRTALSLAYAWIADCLQAGILSRYISYIPVCIFK